jgi:molybdenum cofactor cytidylyltransferase
MLAVIVLAAGLSRRMGGANKLLLPFAGKTLLEATLDRVLAAGIGETLVVLGHDADRVQALLAPYAVRTAVNPDFTGGMTTSIQAGIRAASPAAEGFMICLADMPLIEPAIYCELAAVFSREQAREPRTIVQPVYRTTPGNPVVLPALYREQILALDFPDGCRPIVRAHKEFVVQVAVDTDAVVRDADTPDDYRRLID